MDEVGYHSLGNVGGGATFDSCIRFLNEDPWERLRQIRREVKQHEITDASSRTESTRIQKIMRMMWCEILVETSIKNGIDIIFAYLMH